MELWSLRTQINFSPLLLAGLLAGSEGAHSSKGLTSTGEGSPLLSMPPLLQVSQFPSEDFFPSIAIFRTMNLWCNYRVKMLNEMLNVSIFRICQGIFCQNKKLNFNLLLLGRYKQYLVIWLYNCGYSQVIQCQSVQFSSVAQLCPTLCNRMDCSTPGFTIHHQLPEPAQTHVHKIGHAIQPYHPLSSPSPPAFNLSHHQGLFK